VKLVKRIGIIGFGRIGAYLYERIMKTPGLTVTSIYETIEAKRKTLDKAIVATSPEHMCKEKLDLVVEAADFRAVKEFAPQVLAKTEMLILSASALADEKLEAELSKISKKTDHRLFIPHGALLGMDGFQDARETFEEITITTTKHPKNLDFTFQNKWRAENIVQKTVLHDGPTRESCKLFPRNVNSHAVLAISSLGFDKTRSVLVADPTTSLAGHHIVAKGGGIVTEISQVAPIKGVTGDYTLASVYGTIRRILLGQPRELNII
jgi:aspartate dehydrogenase